MNAMTDDDTIIELAVLSDECERRGLWLELSTRPIHTAMGRRVGQEFADLTVRNPKNRDGNTLHKATFKPRASVRDIAIAAERIAARMANQ